MSEYPYVDKAIEYAQAVLDNIIPAGYWVQLACQRFLNDLMRCEEDDTWPYTFDPVKASRVCKFIELLPHTKGKWAQESQKLKLEPWQMFIKVNEFGFVRKDTGKRRFLESQVLVPRKNGKTALSSATGLYMLCADNEHGAEVYCGATSHAQALEVFKPAQEMCRRTPGLQGHYGLRVNANNIHILANASKFEPIIGKPKDGASPSCAVIDEYHEHQTSVVYDTMKTGMGARQQPLILAITTAGDNLAGPCYDMVLTGRQLLEGTIVDESRFYIEYTIDETDDWADPNVLAKANPNLEVSVFKEFLVQAQKEAISNPRKAGVFRTKHLNQWIASKNAYFNIYNWNNGLDESLTEYDARLVDQPCIMALDLAAKVDIAALVLLFGLPDGHYVTLSRFYLPEKIADEPGNQHYRAWADAGKLILTPGNMIDHQWIKDDIDELFDKFDCQHIVFDPAQANWMMGTLMNDGKPVAEFPQTAQNFSEPMRQLAGLIDSGKIIHNSGPNDPMTWMMSNVVSKTNRKDQDFPDKERPEKKIDGPVALIMAMSKLLYVEDKTSIYETQQPIFF